MGNKNIFGSDYFEVKKILEEDFIDVVRSGDLEKVTECIDKGANVHLQDEYGDYPLHIAVTNGNLEMVKLLINKGADVNLQNKYGDYPLHIAVTNGYVEIAKLLINKGADVIKMKNNILSLLPQNKKDLKISVKKGQDKEKFLNLLSEFFNNYKDIKIKTDIGFIQRIEILQDKNDLDKFKIILREDEGEKTYARYICKKERNGYRFEEIHKKKRQGLLKLIHNTTKLLKSAKKKIYKKFKMETILYKELVNKIPNKQNISRSKNIGRGL